MSGGTANLSLRDKVEWIIKELKKLKALVASLSGGSTGVQTISGDSVDNTDPTNPIVNAVASLTGWAVNNTDPSNPVLLDPRPYKVYTALLTQTSTNNPVVTILENTLPGVPVIARSFSAGLYDVSLVGAYTANKTAVFISQSGIATSQTLTIIQSVDNILISTSTAAGIATDGILTKAMLEIRVYN